MTKLFEDAVEKARALPSGMQDDIARLIETFAVGGQCAYDTSGRKSRPLASATAHRRWCGVTRRECISISDGWYDLITPYR